MAHRLCRFCDLITDDANLVKYGVRHYAHFGCYLDAGKTLDDLTTWQVGRFPHGVLQERGLIEQVKSILGSGP